MRAFVSLGALTSPCLYFILRLLFSHIDMRGTGSNRGAALSPASDAMSEARGVEPTGTRIQSVSRATRILLAVAAAPTGLTAKSVADLFGLSLPTAYHLLNTLESEQVLLKDPRRRYLLGPAVGTLADAYARTRQVPEKHRAAVRRVAAETGETAYLSGWRNGSIVVLATEEGSHAVRVAGLTAGYGEDLHARASGKLLLAHEPREVREELLSTIKLRRRTPNTITTRAALRRELDKVLEEGLAHDRGEFDSGVECLSAPIWASGAVVAALTVSCPQSRFYQSEDAVRDSLVRAAAYASTD